MNYSFFKRPLAKIVQLFLDAGGSCLESEANLSGSVDDSTRQFIDYLEQSRNVILHGLVSSLELAEKLQTMDAFLICYDVQKDQSKGTNYHKVIEYISTGKITIANNITAYKNEPGLVQMVEERENNNKLPTLFIEIMSSLDNYNTLSLQEGRKRYGARNTYSKQIERIEQFLKTSDKN